MHALTSEKIKKSYNNQFFEFLGDGVLAVFLAWYLVISNPNSKDTDVDKLRIEHSSSKKLFQIATNEVNYFEDYLIHPGYKILEYFVPPVIKKGSYFDIKHFELAPEVKQLYISMKTKIQKVNEEYKLQNEGEDEKDNEIDEEELDIEFDHSEEFDSSSHPREYRCFITELYKNEYFKNEESDFEYKDDPKIEEAKKKSLKGCKNEKIKHSDISTMLKAMIGAVFNCLGFSATSKFLKFLEITKEEWKIKEKLEDSDL